MSRPFSYNDENFTVIGNILFLHIKITKEFNENSNIIEIPQAIYDRMCNKSKEVQITSNRDNNDSIHRIDVGIRKDTDGKYYLYSSAEYITNNYVGFYLVAWYYLKDI
jgi:hypothetical protein